MYALTTADLQHAIANSVGRMAEVLAAARRQGATVWHRTYSTTERPVYSIDSNGVRITVTFIGRSGAVRSADCEASYGDHYAMTGSVYPRHAGKFATVMGWLYAATPAAAAERLAERESEQARSEALRTQRQEAAAAAAAQREATAAAERDAFAARQEAAAAQVAATPAAVASDALSAAELSADIADAERFYSPRGNVRAHTLEIAQSVGAAVRRGVAAAGGHTYAITVGAQVVAVAFGASDALGTASLSEDGAILATLGKADKDKGGTVASWLIAAAQAQRASAAQIAAETAEAPTPAATPAAERQGASDDYSAVCAVNVDTFTAAAERALSAGDIDSADVATESAADSLAESGADMRDAIRVANLRQRVAAAQAERSAHAALAGKIAAALSVHPGNSAGALRTASAAALPQAHALAVAELNAERRALGTAAELAADRYRDAGDDYSAAVDAANALAELAAQARRTNALNCYLSDALAAAQVPLAAEVRRAENYARELHAAERVAAAQVTLSDMWTVCDDCLTGALGSAAENLRDGQNWRAECGIIDTADIAGRIASELAATAVRYTTERLSRCHAHDGTFGKYGSAAHAFVASLAQDGWADMSDGNVDSPTGWFAIVSITPAELGSVIDAFDIVAAEYGAELSAGEIVGYWVLRTDSDGREYAAGYSDAGDARLHYRELSEAYSADIADAEHA